MMTGNEPELNVYLGKDIIAKITLSNDQLYWHYSLPWQQSGYAVSPHLPLNHEIPTLNVQRFLRNLLPEGGVFDELVKNFHLSKNNTFGLIQALGMDTSGSLVMLASSQPYPQKSSFRIITDKELIKRLNTRDQSSLLFWDGKPRLSLAGVQEKINVLLKKNGQLGFGEGSLCSTHILKFEKLKVSHLVLNEYITLQLAKKCGLSVANVQMKQFGEHATLLIERFDRYLVSDKEVKRRQIIDGCQALNLPPEYKYERNFGNARDVAHIRDGASISKLFDFTNQCANPALAKQQLLDWVLFNLLVFNFDAHGKNISFYVGAHGVSITPFYDLVNIKMYPDFDHEMAMGIGDEFNSDDIHAYQLADFADSCQLARSFLVTRLKLITRKLMAALDDKIEQMARDGDERKFIKKYRTQVYPHCVKLLAQSDELMAVKL